MTRINIIFILLVVFSACGRNEIATTSLPLTFKSYNDNYIERSIWRLEGIDTILYGGSLQLNKDSFLMDGCYCLTKGTWEQRNDSLFLYRSSGFADTTKPKININCDQARLDSIFLIKKNGTALQFILNEEENKIRILSSVKYN